MFVGQGKPISYIEKVTFTWVRAASFRLPKLATGSASILRGLNDFLSSPSLSATTSHTAAAPVPPFRKFAVNWTTKINEEKLIKGYKGLLQDVCLLYLKEGNYYLGTFQCCISSSHQVDTLLLRSLPLEGLSSIWSCWHLRMSPGTSSRLTIHQLCSRLLWGNCISRWQMLFWSGWQW